MNDVLTWFQMDINDYECVFVAEPVEQKDGFVMYAIDCASITANRWKTYGTACYSMELRIECYNELRKHKLYDLTFEQWELMPKPRMLRAEF